MSEAICLRLALAELADVAYWETPDFVDDDTWWPTLRSWAREHHLEAAWLELPEAWQRSESFVEAMPRLWIGIVVDPPHAVLLERRRVVADARGGTQPRDVTAAILLQDANVCS